MTKKTKIFRPKARLPKGFRDIRGSEIRVLDDMIARIRDVYEIYGFDALETPAFEYTDALGKFLPDQDRPNAGVFSLEDEDGQWMSLRYDLTAPLARFVAQNYDELPKPFRRYQTGAVFRNEKPGPGRYRQFTQFDADTVGTESVAADAELCMLASETLKAIGIPKGSYIIKVNNRKLLDAVLLSIGINSEATDALESRLTILRAIDKLDRLGTEGVERLLGKGRKDESGDFTKGAGLEPGDISKILAFVNAGTGSRGETLKSLEPLVSDSEIGQDGLDELRQMDELLSAANVGGDEVAFDPSVVRGLDYYTGPVFEAELTFETKDDKGSPVRFGSVGGGGRYDGLVARFKGVKVPATGFSIGVSRLQSALEALGQGSISNEQGPVLILVMDRERLTDYQSMAQELRASGIRAEMYLGTSAMRAQMKYADKRGAPCVIIQGEDEREKNQITIKDLKEGTRLSAEITDNKEWREGRPAQFAVSRDELVEAVAKLIVDQAATINSNDPGASS